MTSSRSAVTSPTTREWQLVTNGKGVPLTARTWKAAQGDLYVFAHWVWPGETFAIFEAGVLVPSSETIVNGDKEKTR